MLYVLILLRVLRMSRGMMPVASRAAAGSTLVLLGCRRVVVVIMRGSDEDVLRAEHLVAHLGSRVVAVLFHFGAVNR